METKAIDKGPLHILLVEDNPGDVYLIKELIKTSETQFTFDFATRLNDAIKISGEKDFDLILLDLGLPDSVGLETLKKFQASEIKAPVVIMTGLDDEDAAITALKEGAQDYLVKNNLTSENILRAIRYSIERKKIRDELQKLNDELDLKIQLRTQELAELNTLLKLELEEHKQTSEKLKEINATKDKFFGIIAHDLKNPFCGLLTASEILINYVEQFDYDKIKSISTSINNSAKQGNTLLENLLEWSRSQTGKLEFNPQKLNIKELIEENITNMMPFAGNKNIEILSDISPDIEAIADKDMLNTVLRNLLSNAVKFTHKNGEVFISAIQECADLTIVVKDTGIGINEKDMDKLFRIDTQFTSYGTAKEKGSGLGLVLCREFIEKHGGRIWVESKLGKGSEFKFKIPVLHTASSKSGKKPKVSFEA